MTDTGTPHSPVKENRATAHTGTIVNRRSFGRMLGLGAAAEVVPTVAFGPSDVGARRDRCRADPLFPVVGEVVDVMVVSQLERSATTTGPVRIKLTTPVGVKATHLVSDFGFGYDITYATDGSRKGGQLSPQVRAEMLAPSAADLPISISFTRIGVLGQVELRSVETPGPVE